MDEYSDILVTQNYPFEDCLSKWNYFIIGWFKKLLNQNGQERYLFFK